MNKQPLEALRRLFARLPKAERAAAQELLKALEADQTEAETRTQLVEHVVHDAKNLLQALLPTLKQYLPEDAHRMLEPQLRSLELQLQQQLSADQVDANLTEPLGDYAKRLAEQFAPAFSAARLRFWVHCDDGVVGTEVPVAAFSQVLNNLLINSLKYSPSGDVCVDFVSVEGELQATVTDEGLSIGGAIHLPEDEGHDIRGKRAGSKGLRSVGLVLEQHGWSLRLEPRDHAGTLARLSCKGLAVKAKTPKQQLLNNRLVLLALPAGDYTQTLERELKALGATVLHRPQLAPDFHPVGYDIILYDPAALLSSTQRELLHAIENAIPISLQIEGAANLPAHRQALLSSLKGVLEAPSTHTADKAAHIRTLLVEDEPFSATAIRQQLSPYRFELLIVDSGLAALRSAQQQSFDLVFMDWQLPDVEPDRVIQKLREVQPEAKLVVLSGYSKTQVELEHKTERRLAGWMSKPLNIKRLFELLELDEHSLRRNEDEPPQHVSSPRTNYRLTPTLVQPVASTQSQTGQSAPSRQFLQLLLPLVNELHVSLSRGDYDALFTPLQLLKAYLSRTDWETLQTPVRRFERKLQELDIEALEPILLDIQELATQQLAATQAVSA